MNGLLLFQEAAYGRGEEHRLIIGMRHHEKVKIRLGIARHTCNRKEGEEGRKEMANRLSIARLARPLGHLSCFSTLNPTNGRLVGTLSIIGLMT